MAKLAVYNLKGETTSEENIPVSFGKVVKDTLTAQAVNRQMANHRSSIANTKTCGEVSGGGRKPWKQKGTGRARAGSTRSPLWIGGGITFGPTSLRNFSKRLPQKMVRASLNSAISQKIKDKKLILVESLEIEKISTKSMYQLFSKLPIEEGKILVIINSFSPNLELSLANISYAKVIKIANINLLDLLRSDYIVIEKKAFESLEKKVK